MRKMTGFLLMILAGYFHASILGAKESPSPALLVLNKSDNTLAIIDPVSLKVVGKAPAGRDPHEVVASADGKWAYISNYGGFGEGYKTLSVVNLTKQKAVKPVDLGALTAPHGLAWAGGKVYFTAERSKVIGSYDPAAKKIDWVLGLGQNRTHMIVVSKDTNLIATSNVNSDTISIIEKTMNTGGPGHGPNGGPHGGAPNGSGPHNGSRNPVHPHFSDFFQPPKPHVDWNVTNVPVGKGPEGFDLSPDEKEIWAANSHDGTVSIIDVAKKKVTATLKIHTRFANRLKFTPDGTKVLISDLGGDGVVVVNVKTRREIKRISLGGGAAGILMQPDGSRAYVAVGSKNGISVIDLDRLEEVGFIESGNGPDGLGWAVR